ncbi:MAG: sigma-54 dependent transcriptional regulator [bacterium]
MKRKKKNSEHILIVDDEESIRTTLGGVLSDEGFSVSTAHDGESALQMIEDSPPDLVMLDIWLPGMDGVESLQKIKETYPELPVVMISGHGTIETAVKSTRLGAYDYIEKPLSLDKIIITIQNALELTRLSREYRRLSEEMAGKDELIGQSRPIKELRSQIEKVAPTEGWVLISGENGTGKEVLARMIHRGSLRSDRPFVSVNCAAIPEELIESELFGHEKGAFTGAVDRKQGKFDMADGGTLFLDEIADMSLRTQSKILRILQEQQFERVGGTSPIKVDVRVIAASNKDLEKAMQEGSFREDLYYRLNVIPLYLPPLRERKEDIPLFVDHFLKDFCARSRLKQKKINKRALQAFMQYSWPGNVRELKNVIERMVILSPGGDITVKDLPPALTSPGTAPVTSAYDLPTLKEARNAFEKQYLMRKLIENDHNVSRTAEQVGVERSSLHRKIKSYGIDGESEEGHEKPGPKKKRKER